MICVALITAISSISIADTQQSPLWLPLRWNSGDFFGDIQGRFFFTSANHSFSGGEYETLPNENEYSHFILESGAGFGLSPDWRILGGFQAVRGAIKEGSGAVNRWALSGLSAEAAFRLIDSKFTMLLVGEGFLTLDPIDPETADIIVSDGVSWFMPALEMGIPSESYDLFGRIGLKVRDEGLSKLLMWQVGAQLKLTKFRLGGSLYGYESVIQDDYMDEPEVRTDVLDRVNGSSYIVYAPDPMLFSAAGWMGVDFAPGKTLTVGFNKTLNGAASPEGWGFFTAFTWAPSTTSSGKNSVLNEIRKGPQRGGQKKRPSQRGFQPEVEEIDPRILQKERQEYGDDGEPLESTENLMEQRFRDPDAQSE